MNKIVDYIKNNYCFYILFGLTLAFHFVSAEAFLIGVVFLSLFYILLDLITNKKNPLDKKYIIIIPLLLYLVVGLMIGITHRDYIAHNIMRDIFYHTNTLAIIVLALSMFTNKISEEQVFWCILLVGTIMGGIVLYKIVNWIIIGNEVNFQSIRYEIKNLGYLVNFIAPFSFLFIKKYKYITIPLSFFNILMAFFSFSRVGLILIFVIAFFSLLYYIINWKKNGIILIIVLSLLSAGTTILVFIFFNDFAQKIFNSFNEINPNLDWSDEKNIDLAWRGYEIWMITDKYNNSSLFVKMFGNGFGSYIYSDKGIWVEDTIVHNIAIFHNGYYGALFKCGLVGLLIYIFFLFSLYYFSFKYIKNRKDLFFNISLITYVVIASYVVMGIFHKEVWFTLIFLITYLIKFNANISYNK